MTNIARHMWTIGFADRLRLRQHPHRHNRQAQG